MSAETHITTQALEPVPDSTPQRPARVMIVDDHPIVLKGIAALLAGCPDIIVSAQISCIAEAMQLVECDPPDLAVIDISLKNESGLDLIRQIKQRCNSVRMLAVSMHDENLYGELAQAAGAMGYLNKQSASHNIVDALRRIVSGEVYLSDELKQRTIIRQATGLDPIRPSGMSLLTPREMEVFCLIGAGLTTSQIATKLLLSTKTIETHRLKIKSRLNLRNSSELSCQASQWVLLNR